MNENSLLSSDNTILANTISAQRRVYQTRNYLVIYTYK